MGSAGTGKHAAGTPAGEARRDHQAAVWGDYDPTPKGATSPPNERIVRCRQRCAHEVLRGRIRERCAAEAECVDDRARPRRRRGGIEVKSLMQRIGAGAGATALVAAVGLVGSASPAMADTAAGITEDAAFSWAVNEESGGGAYFGGANWLVAGEVGDVHGERDRGSSVWDAQDEEHFTAEEGNTTITRPDESTAPRSRRPGPSGTTTPTAIASPRPRAPAPGTRRTSPRAPAPWTRRRTLPRSSGTARSRWSTTAA